MPSLPVPRLCADWRTRRPGWSCAQARGRRKGAFLCPQTCSVEQGNPTHPRSLPAGLEAALFLANPSAATSPHSLSAIALSSPPQSLRLAWPRSPSPDLHIFSPHVSQVLTSQNFEESQICQKKIQKEILTFAQASRTFNWPLFMWELLLQAKEMHGQLRKSRVCRGVVPVLSEHLRAT